MRLIFFIVLNFVVYLDLAQNINWQWVKGAGGAQDDYGSEIHSDAAGNIYVAGAYASVSISISGITLFNASTSTVVPGSTDFFVAKYNASGNLLWVKSAGDPNNDLITDMTVDLNGNCYITGIFNDTALVLDNTILTAVNGYEDIFTVKYDSSGNVVWARCAGGNWRDRSSGIAVDDSGNVVITGEFTSDKFFIGNDTFSLNYGAPYWPREDLFIAKYNSSGSLIWAKKWGSVYPEGGNDVGVDVSGNIYLTGYFNGPTFSLGSTTLTNACTSCFGTPSGYIGEADIFVAKFDPGGNVIWEKNFGKPGNDYFSTMAVSKDGRTYLGSGPSNNSYFLSRYDTSGSLIWSKTHTSIISDIAVNAAGQCFLTGSFSASTLSIGASTVANTPPNCAPCNGDVLYEKYDASGNELWAISAGGSGWDSGLGITIDPFGNGYIIGRFSSYAFFAGSNSLTSASTSSTAYDMFIAKLGHLTNVLEYDANNILRIFPNPSRGEINIIGTIIEDVKFTDLLGQTVYGSQPLKADSAYFLIEKPGLYFITITSNGRNVTKKVLIN